jgi:hypothetical protein
MKKLLVFSLVAIMIMALAVPAFAETLPAPLLGDVNGDSAVTIADAIATMRYVMLGITNGVFMPARADMDGDGTVGIADTIIITRIALGLS